MNKSNSVTLDEICVELSDGLHAAPIFNPNGEYLFVNANNLINGRICDIGNGKRADASEYEKYRIDLDYNTLLYSIDGSIGYVAKYQGEKVILGKGACYLRLKPFVFRDYIYYLFQSDLFKRYIKTMQTGSTIHHISLETMRNFRFELPDAVDQKKIASLPSMLDERINLNKSVAADLEAMAKLLYDYWFVQFDFPDVNGKPYKSSGGKMVWNDDLKREIPEGWEAGTFGDVLSALECGNRQSGGAETFGIPSIGAEKIIGIGKYDFSDEKYISEDYYRRMTAGVVKSWDVLVYKDGAGVGQASMFGDGFPYEKCAINSHAFILRSEEHLYQSYLYLTLCQNYIKKIIVSLAMKAAQPGLNQPDLKSVQIVIPDKFVLKNFNSIVDMLFHKIFACANENKQLSSLRDFLLPMLMNGQVKVGGKGDLHPVAYPTDEIRDEYMVAAEPHKAYDAEKEGV